jgi:RNA polymerase sigma factor (sigma-70 family)
MDLFPSAREHPAHFAAIFRAYKEPLLWFFLRAVADYEVASDLTAETFAVAFASLGQFRGRSDVQGQAWLWTIAKHGLFSWRRRQRQELGSFVRLATSSASIGVAPLDRVEESVDAERLRPRIRSAISRLPVQQQEAICLRVVDELNYEEIAARLGITRENARARVSRGSRTLALEMDDLIAPRSLVDAK